MFIGVLMVCFDSRNLLMVLVVLRLVLVKLCMIGFMFLSELSVCGIGMWVMVCIDCVVCGGFLWVILEVLVSVLRMLLVIFLLVVS